MVLLCNLSSIHLTLFKEDRVSTSRADKKEVPMLKMNPKVKPIVITMRIEGKRTFLKIIKGMNFCSVENKKKNFHAAVLIILKNQPWKGKTPNFIIILRRTITWVTYNLKEKSNILNKNHREAILWTKKYFILFSSSYIFLLKEIKGRNINMFNSNLNQRLSQLLLKLASKTLKTSRPKITIKEGINIITL